MVWLKRTNGDWFHLLKSDQWAGCILSLWRSTVKLLSYAFLLKTLLPFLFRSEEHLGPPSKDLHLTDNCNSLHSRLCLLTSHESSFALCIVGDLHPPYFRVLRNTELQSHVFLNTRAGCVCAGSSLFMWDCLWQSINLVHDKWKCLYFSLVCTMGGATRTERSETKTQRIHPLGRITFLGKSFGCDEIMIFPDYKWNILYDGDARGMVTNDVIKIFQVHPHGTTNIYKHILGKTGKLLYK